MNESHFGEKNTPKKVEITGAQILSLEDDPKILDAVVYLEDKDKQDEVFKLWAKQIKELAEPKYGKESLVPFKISEKKKEAIIEDVRHVLHKDLMEDYRLKHVDFQFENKKYTVEIFSDVSEDLKLDIYDSDHHSIYESRYDTVLGKMEDHYPTISLRNTHRKVDESYRDRGIATTMEEVIVGVAKSEGYKFLEFQREDTYTGLTWALVNDYKCSDDEEEREYVAELLFLLRSQGKHKDFNERERKGIVVFRKEV